MKNPSFLFSLIVLAWKFAFTITFFLALMDVVYPKPLIVMIFLIVGCVLHAAFLVLTSLPGLWESGKTGASDSAFIPFVWSSFVCEFACALMFIVWESKWHDIETMDFITNGIPFSIYRTTIAICFAFGVYCMSQWTTYHKYSVDLAHIKGYKTLP